MHLAQHLGISEDDNTILRSCECNIQTPRIVQESNALMLIASHAAEDDIVLLTTLKGIHACDFDFFVKIFLESAVELHVVDDIRPLSFVRGYNTDLARHNARFEKLRDDFLYVGSFGPRDIRKMRTSSADEIDETRTY